MLLYKLVTSISKTHKIIYKEQKRYMEALVDKMLVDVYGKKVPAKTALKHKDYLVYFFAASWCGACQIFLPKVKKLYEAVCERHAKLEIIYISYDSDPDTMMSHFKENHGHWFAIPFDDKRTVEELTRRFDVTHVPYMVVVKKDGTIVSTTAKKELEDYGNNVLVTWISANFEHK